MPPKESSPESSVSAQESYKLPSSSAEQNSSVQEKLGNGGTTSSGPAKEVMTPDKERELSDPEQGIHQQVAPTLPAPNATAQPAVSQPKPATQSVDDNITDDNPLIADDVDVIEKEWVDRAKKIIDQTKDYPYEQEKQVERLQQSYLKKRYGKELPNANGS